MTKLIPRVSSRRNGRIGSRKNGRRISKGVIHVQASFNNTIVTDGEILSPRFKITASARSFVAALEGRSTGKVFLVILTEITPRGGVNRCVANLMPKMRNLKSKCNYTSISSI